MLTVDRFVFCFRSLRCSDIAPHVSTYLYINQLVGGLRVPGDDQSINALRIPKINKALLAFTSTGSIPLLVNHFTTGCLFVYSCCLLVVFSFLFFNHGVVSLYSTYVIPKFLLCHKSLTVFMYLKRYFQMFGFG